MRKPRALSARISLVAFLTLLFAVSTIAQNNKGAIVGTVKDPNDALVAKAQVKVTSVKTGEVRTTDTSDDGTFTVTNLEPGPYTVTVEASGFQSVTIEAIQVETNARQPLDVKFASVATSSASVTITAESAPLVESETSVRGDLITGRQVTDLPIPQRNFTLLAGLSPGVTRPNLGLLGGGGNFVVGGGGQNNTESTRFRESGGSVLVVNGARATNNNFTLDGVDNNESQFGQIAIYPQPDAIAEFKVESSVPSAESGRAGGGIISTTFKSGGNDFHGTVGEIYQGRFLSAAAGKFDDPTSPDVPNYVTHQFYGTVGGPIFLPRPGEGTPPLYNGRNRSFFFFSYNGQRNSTPIFGGTGDPQAVPVPTARMRVGDFSELLHPNEPLIDYALASGGTIKAVRGTIFAPNGTPIPGNDLRNCPSCGPFSPFALAYINAFPLPNLAGAGRNFQTNRKEHAVVDSYDIRIDHKITDKNTLFGRYSKSSTARARDNFFPLGTSPNGNDLPAGPSAGDEFGDAKGFTMNDTHIFSPSIVNDARFGVTRVQIGIFNTGVNGTGGFSPTVSANLGAPNINISPNTSGIVLVGIVDGLTNEDRATEFTGDGGPFYFLSNNFHFADAVTVVKGNSTYKFGGDYRIRQNSNYDGGRNGGTKGNYQYGTTNSGFVSGNYNGIGPNDTGSSLANFLLGYRPGFVGRGDPGGPYFQSNKEMAFFVQDDWKVNPDLTLNLGLRYDIFTAPTERFDLQSNFVPATNTIQVAGDNAPGGRDLADTDKNNFGPRIGFAYSGFKNDKSLVLRGGYGLLYATDTSAAQPLTANPGTGAGTYQCQPITTPGGCFPFFLARNPFDRGVPTAPFTVQPPGTSFPAPAGGSIRFNDPNRKDEMYHQYNLTWQYEFAPSWMAEAAYVGSSGRNLLTLQNIGTGNDQGGPGSRQITTNTIIAQQYNGSSRYDSLQTKLEKRFSKGLSILSSYTWAHGLDDSPGGICSNGASARDCGPDDPLRPELEHASADIDVRHRFTFANVWDLPFGRNRRFGDDMNRGLDFVVGGWQWNNIVIWQSGPVFNVTCDGGRVDLIGDPTPTSANIAAGRELNPAAFRCSTTRVFAGDPAVLPNGSNRGAFPNIGTLGRNFFRGRQQFYWDASFFKNFPVTAISEAFNVQFRFQAYNVLNRANRSTPNGDINNVNDFGRDLNEQRRRQLEFSLKLIF
jgi:Carboxypeptidase regulatory-like domain/TonB dependent receptor